MAPENTTTPPPSRFLLVLRRNIALEGDLSLARMELEAFLPGPLEPAADAAAVLAQALGFLPVETGQALTGVLDALVGRSAEPRAVRGAGAALAAASTSAPLSHDVHYYKAKFFPRLARSMLNVRARRLGPGPHRVLDNFVGSGTT